MTPPGIVNEADQVSLMFYLEDGGNLYIESADVGKDLDGSILIDYLGMAYKGDGEEESINMLNGDTDAFLSGIEFSYLGGHDAHFYIDHITADEGVPLLQSEDQKTRMIAYEGEGYRTVSSSVAIGALARGDSLNMRAYAVSQIVDFFNDNITIGIDEDNKNGILDFATSYPNPFVSEVRIKYVVLKKEKINISIFDIKGQNLATLVDETQSPGEYEVSWNADGHELIPGMYFYRIQTATGINSGKMIYKSGSR